jgi:isopenicillin-N N-acyltransferase like protein
MDPDLLPVFHLDGSPGEMGAKHGLLARELIEAGIESRMQLCREFSDAQGRRKTDEEIRALAGVCRDAHESFCPGMMRELRAAADAAGVDETDLLIYNGFTDFKDLLFANGDEPGGCTSFAISPASSSDGTGWIGQTWDMYRTALPYVCLLDLKPSGKPHALMVSLAGCVGMFGLNEAGLAVCTNNLHPQAGRPGVFWPFVMRRLLECASLNEAEEILARVTVAGGHNFLLMGPPDDGFSEWEILPYERFRRPETAWTCHTNHCLHESTASMERIDGPIGRRSSELRHQQAAALLRKKLPGISKEDLIDLTRWEEPGELHTVCMRPVEGYDVQTCAAAIMQPSTGTMLALKGRPSESVYQEFRISR